RRGPTKIEPPTSGRRAGNPTAMSMDPFSALPEPHAARRAFDAAAATFSSASVVHDEARERLLERLDFVRIDPKVVLDAGAGHGAGAAALGSRYPEARVIALDSSLPMLRQSSGPAAAIAGHAERLPLKDGTVD